MTQAAYGPDLPLFSAAALAAAVRSRQVSPREIVDSILEGIQQLNPALNAYVTVVADEARQEAAAAEEAVMRGDPLGPLHGVPFSAKDLLLTRGVRTTRGSRLFDDAVPQVDAPIVQRVRSAGAILVGKTTTSEFGFNFTSDSPLTGVTRNPWNLAHSSGGSSGGAAAAVAAGLGPIALGTDGGGSVRLPAAFCGVVGVKPSLGRIPVYPASSMGTLGHVGPIVRTVEDAALVLSAAAGPDERDRHSLVADPGEAVSGWDSSIRDVRIGWSTTCNDWPVETEVAAAVENAARVFSEHGAEVEELRLSLPDPYEIWQVYLQSNLAGLFGDEPEERRTLLDPGVRSAIEAGQRLSAPALARAAFDRDGLWDSVQPLFERFDVLVTPTTLVPAFQAGRDHPATIDGHPASGDARWMLTQAWNLTGQPAASVPCGLTRSGLPLGLQIVGRRFADAMVLRVSRALELARPWATDWPPITRNLRSM